MTFHIRRLETGERTSTQDYDDQHRARSIAAIMNRLPDASYGVFNESGQRIG